MLFAEELISEVPAAQTAAGGLDFTGGSAATSTLVTFLLGLGIVFIGLIALIAIIKIMGAIMKHAGKKETPAAETVPETKTVVSEGDMGEVKAAVAAVIATVLGESVSGIRIVSFKKLD